MPHRNTLINTVHNNKTRNRALTKPEKFMLFYKIYHNLYVNLVLASRSQSYTSLLYPTVSHLKQWNFSQILYASSIANGVFYLLNIITNRPKTPAPR